MSGQPQYRVISKSSCNFILNLLRLYLNEWKDRKKNCSVYRGNFGFRESGQDGCKRQRVCLVQTKHRQQTETRAVLGWGKQGDPLPSTALSSPSSKTHIHPVNKYLLGARYVPSLILGTWNPTVNKTKISALLELTIQRWGWGKHRQ